MTCRPFLVGRLLLHFVTHCLLSGLSTARIILQRRSPPAGFVRLHFAPMSATGAAVLGALVTLTPGSSTIDIDMQRREILLHLLDSRGSKARMASIRRDFERDVALLFPETTP